MSEAETKEPKYKKLVGLIAMIQDAEMYEQTLDTLVEWYGGQSTPRNL